MRMAYDIQKQAEKYADYLKKLGLDINDPIHRAAAFALMSSNHYLKEEKKTTAKLYGKKMDMLTELSLQLSELLSSLDQSYKNCLM